MENFDMSAWPGRTYRYYQGTPLFSFGQGLSYTTFTHNCTKSSRLDFECSVTNTGTIDGDEVVMVFHNVSDTIRSHASHPIPLKALVAFERVTVKAGETVTVPISIEPSAYQVINADGDRVLYTGSHMIIFSRGNGEDFLIEVKINFPLAPRAATRGDDVMSI
jgi:beta-glucosidase